MPRGVPPNPAPHRLEKALPTPPPSSVPLDPSPPPESPQSDHDHSFPDRKRAAGPGFLSRVTEEARSALREAATLFDGVPVGRILLVALSALIFVVPGVLLTVPSDSKPVSSLEAVLPTSFWGAYFLGANPFESSRAEQWEQELAPLETRSDGESERPLSGVEDKILGAWTRRRSKFPLEVRTTTTKEVVPAINPSTATRPLVRMIFGPQGSGKTTVRLLAQRNTQGRGWGKSTTWFTLDAAEVGKNIAHFQSFLWRNAGTVTRIAYNQESYLRARFHLDFTAGDLADMLLVKAVTGLVSGSVTSRPSRLKPESAACLARLANTYYGGSNETLVNFTALLRVTPLADDATIERKEVKVVPPSASPVYECPTMEDNGDMGPLKTFLRLSKEMSVGDLVFSLDGLSDNALFRGDSGSRAVKALVKAASDPTFVDILNAEKISFWIFVPGAVDSILEKETRERLSDSEHVIVDLTYDVADLLRIADQRFSTYQTCANRVTNPSVAGGHSFWASWGFAKDFYDVPCPRTFRDLFCNVQEKDWVEEAVTKACWLKTPRQILAVFREVVRLLASEKPVDSTSPRSFCISEDLFIKALRDLKRSESLS